jgi:hypothetical protein
MKKEVRPIKSLLIILRDNVEENLKTGLCKLSDDLRRSKIITFKEFDRLYLFINEKEPIKGRFKRTNFTWYWSPGEKEIRIQWLNYQIKKTPYPKTK